MTLASLRAARGPEQAPNRPHQLNHAALTSLQGRLGNRAQLPRRATSVRHALPPPPASGAPPRFRAVHDAFAVAGKVFIAASWAAGGKPANPPIPIAPLAGRARPRGKAGHVALAAEEQGFRSTPSRFVRLRRLRFQTTMGIRAQHFRLFRIGIPRPHCAPARFTRTAVHSAPNDLPR